MEGSSSPSAVPQTPVADSVPRILLVDDADQVKDRKPPPEYQRAIAIEVWREVCLFRPYNFLHAQLSWSPQHGKTRYYTRRMPMPTWVKLCHCDNFEKRKSNQPRSPRNFVPQEPNLAKIRRLLQQYDLNLLLYDAESGNSTVHRFAFLGCLDLLRLVLNDPESKIDGRNTLSRTPLHIACEKNHKAIAEELLSRKADANAVTSGGSTPLHFACRAEAVGVVLS